MSSATVTKERDKTKPQHTLKPHTTSQVRKTYIEFMRIIAAFLVIVNHTNSDVFLKYCEPKSSVWFFSLTYFFISKMAVPVFFMIMGGLLLQKVDSPKKSFQRVIRIIIATIIFSLVYYIYLNRNALDTLSVNKFFKTIFTNRITNAYWYLYSYIGLLIILPILQRMAQAFSKKTVLYFITISMGIMGVLPLINIFFHITPHHYLTDMMFVPMLGIVFVGYYIERYLKVDGYICLLSVALFVFLIIFEVAYTQTLYNKNPASYLYLDNWQYLNITLSALCFYIIVKYLSTVITTPITVSKIICYLGSLTFGIYLLSDLIKFATRTYYNNLCEDMAIMPATIIWEIIIFAICAAITAVLKFIPGLKKLI